MQIKSILQDTHKSPEGRGELDIKSYLLNAWLMNFFPFRPRAILIIALEANFYQKYGPN